MSGIVPKWLEHLLGVEGWVRRRHPLDPANSWPLAPWLTLLVVGGCLAVVVTCYLREASSAGRAYRLALAAIRSLLVGMLFFMLAEFLLSLDAHRTAVCGGDGR